MGERVDANAQGGGGGGGAPSRIVRTFGATPKPTASVASACPTAAAGER